VPQIQPSAKIVHTKFRLIYLLHIVLRLKTEITPEIEALRIYDDFAQHPDK